jgi:beta-glucosidase
MMTAPDESAFANAVDAVRNGRDVDEAADELLQQLTRDERLWLLDGDLPFWEGFADMVTNGYNRTPIPMGQLDRLGIPGLQFSDGPRGVVMGNSTAFPVSTARAATWDVDLEERIGTAIGREMRAQGANFFGGVCVNLARHPAWGRAQEAYGEDPIVLGEFGAALTRGVQQNAMAVVKHYALNSMENARFTCDVTCDDAALQEVYLAHFRRIVDEGVAGVMTAYNSVNGEWAGENEYLMEAVLRREWGFRGVTVSDFIWGLRDAAKSLHAGLDVEEPFQQQRAEHLPNDLAEGRASWDDVDRAARRILRTQLQHYATRVEEEPTPDVVFSDAHRALAREAAARSVTLVKNDPVDGRPVLPLDGDSLTSVAVVGRLADVANTGDHGSSDVRAPEVVTALQGLTAALPQAAVTYVAQDDPAAAAAAAAAAEVAVVIVGYTADDEGEFIDAATLSSPELLALFPPVGDSAVGQRLAASFTSNASAGTSIVGSQGAGGDRASLRVRTVDAEIIRAVAAANARTVVAIVAGAAVITEEWRATVPAVLFSWYSGTEGGHALADVLLGKVDAAGRLPFSVPTTEEHLPNFDRNATTIAYDKWYGQRLLDRDGNRAAFPLGFGLSYTTFTIASIGITGQEGETFTAAVTVENTGTRDGDHVIQLYGVLNGAPDFPSRVLLGFRPVHASARETVTVPVTGSIRPLQRWTSKGFAPAATTVDVEAAAYSGDPEAPKATLSL